MLLAEALRRVLARFTPPQDDDAPEVLEIERRAAVAMTACSCGHVWHLHEHLHLRTWCDACGCQRFRPAQPPPPLVAARVPHPAVEALIRLRVSLWTRAWRDRTGT